MAAALGTVLNEKVQEENQADTSRFLSRSFIANSCNFQQLCRCQTHMLRACEGSYSLESIGTSRGGGRSVLLLDKTLLISLQQDSERIKV